MMNKGTQGFRCAMILLLLGGISVPAQAQDEPFIGDIRMVGFNFCPVGWAPAAGQLLPIAQNQALFSLYGTMYGGDGRTTFALPDLRGRTPIAAGQSPGMSNYPQGMKGGAEVVTLTTNEMPSHSHATTTTATENWVELSSQQGSTQGTRERRNGGNPIDEPPPNVSVTLGNTGGSQAHENRTPYMTIQACVALVGIFPSRN